MATEFEKKVEKIFTELYEGYDKGNNWDNAMKKVNELIKKVQEDASRKLKSDRRTLISEVDSTKKSLKKTIRELDNYKKVKVPNLQREVLRLSQKNNNYGSN